MEVLEVSRAPFKSPRSTLKALRFESDLLNCGFERREGQALQKSALPLRFNSLIRFHNHILRRHVELLAFY
jgi:hypothetical protein